MVTSLPPTLLNPILAFIGGPATFVPFVAEVKETTTHDTFLLRGQNDLSTALSGFVNLVGSDYAKRYGFLDNLSTLRNAKQADKEEEALRLIKGALFAIGANLENISVPVSGRLASGAALAVLRDEVWRNEKGAIYFQRFPRVGESLLPDFVPPDHHDVADVTDPGEDLKTAFPRNLTREAYRETLEIALPQETIPIFIDSQQTLGRRILALKYWYFSLNGDVQMQAETANALFDIVIQEEWGDFQEFTVKLLNNLLAKEFQSWMGIYLKKLFAHLSHFDPVRATKPELEAAKAWVQQLGGILYRHVDTFKKQEPSSLEFEFSLGWLLSISDPSMKWPASIREEGFYLWSFIMEDHFEKGRERVHKEIKKLAREETDIDCLYHIVDRHLWRGSPLPIKMVREIIDIIGRRKDLTDEQKQDFRMLVKNDDNDATLEVAANFLSRLFQRLKWRG